jgi:hypothetical protein
MIVALPEKEPAAVLDLTCLLLTGRASEALSDFLGSGDQMSDRVIFLFRTCFICCNIAISTGDQQMGINHRRSVIKIA